MPLLLNEYVFSHYSNVREIIKESISFLSEMLVVQIAMWILIY